MRLVRTNTYAKALKRLRKLGATEPDVNRMEGAIAANPEIGDIIPGAGGLRKLRFAYGNTGKRGGGRSIYYVPGEEVIFMITAYAKADKGDLTHDEIRLFKTLVEELTHDQTH